MVIQAENVPSNQNKRVRDGTAGRKRTIRSGKASSRWHSKPGDAINLRKASLRRHGRLEMCLQIRKTKFEMVRRDRRLPSNQKKQVRNGTTARTFAVKSEKASWEWHDSPDVRRQTGNGSSCDRAVPCIPILAPHSHFRASFTFPRCFAAPAVYAHI